jgi:hypothetical protein
MIKALQLSVRALPRNSNERAEVIQLLEELLAGRQLTSSQQWLADYVSFLNFELE